MSFEELAVHDIPLTKMESTIMGWVQEAIDLRYGAGNDTGGALTPVSMSDGYNAIENMLIRVRGRSDRIDELLTKITQARARAKRIQDQAAFAAKVAYDTATQNNAVSRTTEFSTREERNADAMLASLEEKRLAHQSERMVSITVEAYEVINQIHWSLDSIRKDLRSSLHSLQFESSLER